MTPGELNPSQLQRDALPLRGRVALVTGASGRAGIGYATARRLAALGASLFVHHYVPHDRDQPWGADPDGTQAVIAGVTDALAADGASVHDMELDLAGPGAPAQLISAAADALGHLDILVCNHARSGGDGPLGTWTLPCWMRTGRSTPAPRSCWPRPSPPSTTDGPAAGSSS